MFWSIVLEPGKKYSTVVDNTFHLSMATLDLKTVKNSDDIHTVYVETDNNPRVILCHLSKGSKLFQCPLDHVFLQGTDLKFITTASANIHMTGYLDVSDEFGSDMESEDDEAEDEEDVEESPVTNKNQLKQQGNKRKSEQISPKKAKAIKLDDSKASDEEDSDDEVMDFEDDSDEEGLNADESDDDEEEDLEDEEDDDSEDDDEEEEEDDDEPVINKKSKAEQQKTPKKQVNGNEQKTPKKEQKTPKKEQKTPKGQKTPVPKTPDANQSLLNGTPESSKKKKNKEPKTPLDKTKPDTPLPKDKQQNQQQKLNGGVIIQDLKVGDGALAKPGKSVKVYYIGRLKSTGKVFDSMQKGAGFQFGLQRGEVIKGWDIGIAGMKVGGKRKVICPPHMAYGAKGSPPEIPPNSTLVFEVELKHVN
ncbi:46 kDa FK506-binding nuclear protein isoform X2 [Adelges cooleyi]|uniref:46 kDa FK506-binding nuclear protein isoform X2 n=1 Tax=Adelges cooleyi TaxID=133065 RepID=UPI00217FD0D1|nr:46 kDa FK506-binding nuclear protein isoform X2 [Adelges cooleyi]